MATFVVNGANTTVNFTYTATTTKVLNTVTDAAHELWERGYGNHGSEASPVLFSSLTNQEKLDIVDLYLKQHIISLAKGYHIQEAEDGAASTASTEANTRYL